jgi:AraC family transcriptional regulator, transcriptional activator of pobA
MTRGSLVPTFFLYGEPPRADGGQFVHVEPLIERNRPNNWNIRPHLHRDLNHIMFISAGAGEMNVEGHVTAISAPAALLIPSQMIHSFHLEPDSLGSVMNLSGRYLDGLVEREPAFQALFAAPFCCTMAKGSEEVGLFAYAFAQLSRELGWAAPGHSAAVDAHLMAILVQTLRLGLARGHTKTKQPGPHTRIVAHFRAAIDETYIKPCSLPQYAKRLGVSIKQLRTACLAAAGAPPISLVLDRRMLEARRLLHYSNMTIAEVAYYLGYDDPAYFSRAFRHHVGWSPRNFRNRQSAAGAGTDL